MATPKKSSNPLSGAIVIKLDRNYIGRPAAAGSTRLDRFRSRIRQFCGYAANWLKLPGAIRDIEIIDPVTGQELLVRVGSWFVRLSVHGRDYYFDRFTGRFGGTGSSL
jgi:hypothetical protein